MIEKLQKIREELEKISKTKKIITHKYPDLDNLCAVYLILKKYPDVEVTFVSIDDWFKNKDTLYKDYVAVDMEGAVIDHHDVPGPYATCKLLYQILYNDNPELYEKDFELVDYCNRADKGQLAPYQKQQSSLIHTIYALRAQQVSASKLLKIFIYLAQRIEENPKLLNSMCDIIVGTIEPELSEKLSKETLSFDEIYLKYIRFVKIKDFLVALNYSNHNISSNLFKTMKNCMAIIYSSNNGGTGIILRKPIQEIHKLCEELNKHFPDLKWSVVRAGLCIRSVSLKSMEECRKPSCDEILEIAHKYFTFV